MKARTLRVIAIVAGLLAVLVVGGLIGGTIVSGSIPEGPYMSVPVEMGRDSEPGVVLASVVADSPAAEAGIVRGDILVAIDGDELEGEGQLLLLIGEREPGDEITVTVRHGDDQRDVDVTLGEEGGRAYLGAIPCLGVPGVRVRRPGVTVVRITPDSPAERARLEVGDRIISVDGDELRSDLSLADLLGAHQPGDAVVLEIERDGEVLQLEVELGEHPDREGDAYLGVTYDTSTRFRATVVGDDFVWMPPVPFEFSQQYELLEQEGVSGIVVLRVLEDSPADEAGLEQGDLILEADGEPIESVGLFADTVAAHEPGDTLVLRLYRRGDDAGEREIQITLGEDPDDEDKAYLGVEIGGPLITTLRYGSSLPQREDWRRGWWMITPLRRGLTDPDWSIEVVPPLPQFEFEWLPCCTDDV